MIDKREKKRKESVINISAKGSIDLFVRYTLPSLAKKNEPFSQFIFSGGGGFRTLVLLVPTIEDYTFRIVFSNTPKFDDHYLTIVINIQ